MRRTVLLAAVVVLVGGACGDTDGGSPTTKLDAADVVVRKWIAAIEEGDTASLNEIVAQESLAFVVGVESRLGPAEIMALADDGLPGEVVAGFWSSFNDSFAAIGGASVADLAVGGVRVFDASGARYAAVGLGDADGATEVLLRSRIDGRWQVDILATVGPGLSVALADLAGRADDDRFRTLFEQWVFPGLDAAMAAGLDGIDPAAVRDVRLAFDSVG